MNQEFVEALDQLEKERGIAKEILVEAVEAALVSALKRDQKSGQNIRVQLDPASGEIKVYSGRNVVEEVLDDREEVSVDEAKKIDPHYELGDVVEELIQPKEFGRIAAQTAKQVVVQRIREAERSLIYDEFTNRVGDIVTGLVQRYEQRNVFVDLGKVEGMLPVSEQIPGERYEQGARLKVYIVEVKRTTKGPQVIVSRAKAGLLKRLFELEVPEIQEGLVEIKAVAREPGSRSKIAVYSREPHVDPVGACVGARGNRVQMIVRELRGEKIDIIPWNPDWELFISKAMSPARVAAVQLAPSRKIALIVVPDHQLSLAIGREGQNARLAAKLTGWRIDIRSESQIAMMSEEELEAIIPLEEEYAGPPIDLPELEEEPDAQEESVGVAEDAPAALESESTEALKTGEVGTEPAVEAVEEEEERSKEAPKKKLRKGRTKQREIELELETLDDSGLGFFSDVLESRKKDAASEAGPEGAETPGSPSLSDATTAPATEDDSPTVLAAALRKLQDKPSRKTTGAKKAAEPKPVKPAAKKAAEPKPVKPAAKKAAEPKAAELAVKTAAKRVKKTEAGADDAPKPKAAAKPKRTAVEKDESHA